MQINIKVTQVFTVKVCGPCPWSCQAQKPRTAQCLPISYLSPLSSWALELFFEFSCYFPNSGHSFLKRNHATRWETRSGFSFSPPLCASIVLFCFGKGTVNPSCILLLYARRARVPGNARCSPMVSSSHFLN